MRFENEKDLENENGVIDKFCKKFDAMPRKLNENDIDFSLQRLGIIVAYVEVKCYTKPSTDYEFQILSMAKIVKMQEYDKKAPTFFVLKYSDDVIYFIRVVDIEGTAKYGGRKKRIGSTNDQEMLVYCKKSKMTGL